jgi:hypothetical protein
MSVVYVTAFTTFLDDYKARGNNWATVEDPVAFSTMELAKQYLISAHLRPYVKQEFYDEQIGPETHPEIFLSEDHDVDLLTDDEVWEIAAELVDEPGDYVHRRFEFGVYALEVDARAIKKRKIDE